ncbi:predicted protein [Nematostella vectensis]|uniref:Protein Hikeshi n=2 Tax=Nematostella vectensis TaxID=45351 RepID=A7SJ08_NEMVE|nr:predicted protein [Nematostella vectensis]|eukprot:XP_001628400.1 predicted protein [Nematostella vectensis]
MFGCVVSGRLVQTDAQQVGPTQVVFNLADAESIHHVVVFLTGTVPFPDGMGGAVFYCYPSTEGPAWQLLGFLSNAKPSAIFKIAKVKPEEVVQNPFSFQQNQDHTIAQIGISLEPLDQLAQMTPASGATPSKLNSFVEYTQKMLQNFVNYITSFAMTQSQMVPNPSESYVPMSAVQKWYSNFERKLTNDPNFWKH